MARLFQHTHFLPLLLLLFLLPPSLSEDGEAISVEAPLITVEIGHTATIECSTTEDKTPRWFFGDNATGKSPISEDSSMRIFSDARHGMLTVRNAMQNDSGTYLCQTFSMQNSATVDLKVYKMPSYETEGAVIIAVSVGLLVVIVGALVFQFMQKRKQARKAETKLQARMQPQA